MVVEVDDHYLAVLDNSCVAELVAVHLCEVSLQYQQEMRARTYMCLHQEISIGDYVVFNASIEERKPIVRMSQSYSSKQVAKCLWLESFHFS